MQQLTFGNRPRRDGKPRRRPGPKPGARRGVPHVPRPAHARWNPVQITMRAVRGLPSFRQQLLYLAFEKAIRTTRWPDFRIVEYSVQHDHLHLLAEAESKEALARGMRSFSVRANRLFNAASGRRRGRVWAERYHRRDLATPREVRNALVYCLNNGRKHGVITTTTMLVIDPGSSARWFEGWSLERAARPERDDGPRPTERARTALLRYLWQKHGLLHPGEAPAGYLRTGSSPRSSRWS